MKINNIYKYFYITLIGFVLTGFSETVHAQEDINPKSEEVANESDAKEDVTDLKECLKNAETNKDKKKCKEDDMSTVEEYIKDEGLGLIEGYLKVYADEDKENYFLQINDNDLDKQFLYFAYVMNAPQGSTLTGGRPSDGIVLEFRNFKTDLIGLYKINTAYIYGDDNNIAKSSVTNITEAFIETFNPVARSEKSVLISVNKFMMSEKIEAISYVPKEYREYISINYGKPNSD